MIEAIETAIIATVSILAVVQTQRVVWKDREIGQLRTRLEDGEVIRRDPVEDAPRSMLKLHQDR